MSYGRMFNDEVRKICKNAGWTVWFVHNDKLKSCRKLKYHTNGWTVPTSMKAKIKKQVANLIKAKGLEDIASVDWFIAESYRGMYDKLIITIKHT